MLDRGERPVEAWLGELRRLAEPTYRHIALEDERLWQLLENGGTSPTVRVAAAILLRAHISNADRARLTSASEAIASPQLRALLQHVERSATPLEDETLAVGLATLDDRV